MLNRYITLFTWNVLLGLSESRVERATDGQRRMMRKNSRLLSRRERRRYFSATWRRPFSAIDTARDTKSTLVVLACRQQSLARLRAKFHSLKKLIRCSREKRRIHRGEISPVTIIQIGKPIGKSRLLLCVQLYKYEAFR